MNGRLLLAVMLVTPLAVASSAGLLSLLTGCGEGRFPVCHTDADCQQRDAGKLGNVCVSLRCVECHYDSDCAAGSFCGSTGTCSQLDHPPHDHDGADAGSGEAKSWDPMNWNECAATCKDQDCVGACDRRFHAK
jgi:hypothetical protein